MMPQKDASLVAMCMTFYLKVYLSVILSYEIGHGGY